MEIDDFDLDRIYLKSKSGNREYTIRCWNWFPDYLDYTLFEYVEGADFGKAIHAGNCLYH